jgi:hypothetical protein
MDFNFVDIDIELINFFQGKKCNSLGELNATLRDKTGIVNFFEKEESFIQLKKSLETNQLLMSNGKNINIALKVKQKGN